VKRILFKWAGLYFQTEMKTGDLALQFSTMEFVIQTLGPPLLLPLFGLHFLARDFAIPDA